MTILEEDKKDKLDVHMVCKYRNKKGEIHQLLPVLPHTYYDITLS
mgnify:CR=1 FL=1